MTEIFYEVWSVPSSARGGSVVTGVNDSLKNIFSVLMHLINDIYLKVYCGKLNCHWVGSLGVLSILFDIVDNARVGKIN